MIENFTLRAMTIKDVNGVYEIERLCFTIPWSKDSFRSEIKRNKNANYTVVVSDDGNIIGYGGLWLVIDEAHITNVAIHPEYRRLGIARALIKTMMNKASSKNISGMTLEVRESNIAARNLYQSLGFEKGGLRKGYYPDNGENAIIMWNFHI